MPWPIDRRFRTITSSEESPQRALTSGEEAPRGEFEARVGSLKTRFTTASGLAESWGTSLLFSRVIQPVSTLARTLLPRSLSRSPVAALGITTLAIAGVTASLMTLYEMTATDRGEGEALASQWIVSALYSIPQTLLFAGLLTRLPIRGALAQFIVREPLQAIVAVATQRTMAAAGLVEATSMGLLRQVAIETGEGAAQGAVSSFRVRGIEPRCFGLSMIAAQPATGPDVALAHRRQGFEEILKNPDARPELRAFAQKALQRMGGVTTPPADFPPAGNGNGAGNGGPRRPVRKPVRPEWLRNNWDLGPHLRHDPTTGRYFFTVPVGWRDRFQSIRFADRLDELRWRQGETREEYLKRFGLKPDDFTGLSQNPPSIPRSVNSLERLARALQMPPSVLILGCRPDLVQHCDVVYVRSPLKPDLAPPDPLLSMKDFFASRNLKTLTPAQSDQLFREAWGQFWKKTPLSLHPRVRQELGITTRTTIDVKSGKSPLPAGAIPVLSRLWGLPSGTLYLLSQSAWLPPDVVADIASGTIRIRSRGFSRGNIGGLAENLPREITRLLGPLIVNCEGHEIYGLRRSTWKKLCEGGPVSRGALGDGCQEIAILV